MCFLQILRRAKGRIYFSVKVAVLILFRTKYTRSLSKRKMYQGMAFKRVILRRGGELFWSICVCAVIRRKLSAEKPIQISLK